LPQTVRALAFNAFYPRFFAVGKDNANIMRIPLMQQRLSKQQQLYAGGGIIICALCTGSAVVVRDQRLHLQAGIIRGLPVGNNNVRFMLKGNGSVRNPLCGEPRRYQGAPVCRRF